MNGENVQPLCVKPLFKPTATLKQSVVKIKTWPHKRRKRGCVPDLLQRMQWSVPRRDQETPQSQTVWTLTSSVQSRHTEWHCCICTAVPASHQLGRSQSGEGSSSILTKKYVGSHLILNSHGAWIWTVVSIYPLCGIPYTHTHTPSWTYTCSPFSSISFNSFQLPLSPISQTSDMTSSITV